VFAIRLLLSEAPEPGLAPEGLISIPHRTWRCQPLANSLSRAYSSSGVYPRAWAMLARLEKLRGLMPRSIRDSSPRSTPAAVASCSCVRPFRILSLARGPRRGDCVEDDPL